MIEIFQTIAYALWFILPAYVANGTPVVAGGGSPMDCGKEFLDGRRLLGDGKTFRGFILGLIGGTIIGLLQSNLMIGFTLAVGALFGDILGSFAKRRVRLSKGDPVPGLDQLDFVVGALLLVSLIQIPSWEKIIIILILTPLIHLSTNIIGYKLGFKSEPY